MGGAGEQTEGETIGGNPAWKSYARDHERRLEMEHHGKAARRIVNVLGWPGYGARARERSPDRVVMYINAVYFNFGKE